MTFVASRGLAAIVNVLNSLAARIANDCRKGFKNTYPSDEWVRSFRSSLPEAVTLRRMEIKSAAKILAEHPKHVETMVRSLKDCEKLNPGILLDPKLVF